MGGSRFITQRIRLTQDEDRYYAWQGGSGPDWVQGVVVLSRPVAGASVIATASIIPLATGAMPEYFDVIPQEDRDMQYNFTVDSPFNHLRVRETGASGSEFWVSSNAVLVEVDPETGAPR